MRIEDRDEYVDLIAQAVIDKIEERDKINSLVNQVVNRIIELQREEAIAQQNRSAEADQEK